MTTATVFLATSACATVELAPETSNLEAKRFSPPAGKANIYVVRTYNYIGSAGLIPIHLDGMPAGSLAPNTFLLLEVEPGTHQIAIVSPYGQSMKVVAARPGENYFLRASNVFAYTLEEMTGEEGKSVVASTKRTETLALRVPTAPTRPAAPGSPIEITFSHPAEGAHTSEARLTVVGVVSAPTEIERLELLINGRSVPVSRDSRVQQGDVRTQAFTAQVDLVPGENVIAVTALDSTGRGNQIARRVYRDTGQSVAVATPEAAAGERWAVIIGIDTYRDPAIAPLHYAGADAEAVHRFLTTKGGVKPSNAFLLLNAQATQRNLRQVLGDMLRQKALRDDEVIIYYAGHGTTEPDPGAEGGLAKYLVPWDADSTSLFATAIPMDEIERIFGRLATRKIVMLQDTCFSGGAGGRTFLAKGLTRRAGTLTDRFLQQLTQKEGRLILTASDVNEVSHEDTSLRHGIFTYYLLEGLTGAADLDGDGAVTVRELHLFLQRKVHERSGGAQTPQLYAIGDMVLVQKPAISR